MQLAEPHPVLTPQQRLGDPWRAAIARRLSRKQRRRDLQIRPDELLHLRRGFRRHELANPAAPFGGLSGLRAQKVMNAASGMGLDIAERRWLAAKMQKSAGQKNMLEYIGEIAGMEFVTVIHAKASAGAISQKGAAPKHPAPGSLAGSPRGRHENHVDPWKNKSSLPAGTLPAQATPNMPGRSRGLAAMNARAISMGVQVCCSLGAAKGVGMTMDSRARRTSVK